VSTPGAPYAYSATVFGPSEANGNLTEVGMFTEQSGGVMWSRALFTTPGGSPVVINKQQGDILTVRYTLTVSRTSEDPVVQSITDSRGTTYQVKWILTNNALRGLLDGERWTSNYCRSYTAGNDNSTDPSATQTAINGSAVGTFPSTATRTYETAHQGPSGGFYRVTTLKLDTTYCNGNVKELFIYGIDAYKSSIQSGLCVAMTFNNSGNGLQKTIDDEITLPIRMVFSR